MSTSSLRKLLLIGATGLFACVPPPEPAVGVAYVERAPPRPFVEAVGIPPRDGVIWMRGYWRWNGAEFAWVPGQWVAVQPGYRTWVPGRWIKTRRGWYFIEGHWR